MSIRYVMYLCTVLQKSIWILIETFRSIINAIHVHNIHIQKVFYVNCLRTTVYIWFKIIMFYYAVLRNTYPYWRWSKTRFFFRCSHKLLHLVNYALMSCFCFSMDGSDLCFEVVRRATAGFVYSEAVAR